MTEIAMVSEQGRWSKWVWANENQPWHLNFIAKEESEMRIVLFISRHRRDFTAELQCENCQHRIILEGYDDRYYHDRVVPTMRCPRCGVSRNDLKMVEPPHPTRYPDWLVV